MACDKDCQLIYRRHRDDGVMIVYCEDHRHEFVVRREQAKRCDAEECEAVALLPESLCPKHRRRALLSR